MKKILILLVLLSCLSLIPAQDVNETVESEILEEYEEEFEEVKDFIERPALFRVTEVIESKGYMITKEGELNAEHFRIVLMSKRFIEEEGQDVRQEDKGFVMLGFGDEKEKYTLRKKQSNENVLMFNLMDKDNNSIGEMESSLQKYEHITLLIGEVKVYSGKYVGQWDVNAIANARKIKPKIEKPAKWNIFAFNQREEAKKMERAQEKILEKIKEEGEKVRERIKEEGERSREAEKERRERLREAEEEGEKNNSEEM